MEWNRMVPELIVSDFKASMDFYTRLCGFKVVNERENPYFAYLDLNSVQIMLEEHHDKAWTVDELKRPFGRGINFQIEVDDARSIYD